MNPKITLEHWAAFVAVIDEGSYSKAAILLGKSQSTVSYAISRIEEQLGGAVLKMKGRKAELTDLGKVMLRKARRLLEDAAGIESLAACLNEGWESEITLVIDALYPLQKVLDALEVFAIHGRSTRVKLMETSLSGTDEMLFAGEADLVLTPRIPTGFVGQNVAEAEFVPVAHPQHELHQLGRAISMQDLEQYRQVVLRDTGSRRNQDAGWLKSEQRLTVSHFHTSIEVLKRGLAFAFLPRSYVEQELALNNLMVLPLEGGERGKINLYLINARGERSGPATKLMANILLNKPIDQSL
ncbi:LysR family transcriptional regulator [Pleionea sp. CnH1-48]|uniref:LysR family transcriptional regulator n=1 Tax=Pleionea sp. CnH1-48 TaxID=2954494 RepID=UPI002097FD0A|nr:LysR family transcriptional regulator [Pleionea sp. CnH1-48]MCO7227066.1 LysR family transcriptional regulator [Pleionea sp. CnH1-48]